MPTAPAKVHPHSSTAAAAGTSESPHDSTDAALHFSQILPVMDSVKEKVEADRHVDIKKRIEANRIKVAEITHNHHQLSVERRKLGSINGGKTENLLAKKQKAAIDLQNGVDLHSSQKDEHGTVILLGSGIAVKNSVQPIILPKMDKIPRYTTWTFLKRNQRMTDDQSVVGRRRIYYDQNGGEALVCSDSEEEFINEEEDKNEFVESEDNIIRMTIEQVGASDIVFDALAQRMSRKPCELKARYEALVSRKNAMESSKSENIDSKMSSFLDKDLEGALDTFDKLFCRRCYIFDCKLHGCSQELIIPAKRQPWNVPYEENVPCGPDCNLKLEGTAGIPPMQLDTEQTTRISSEASGVEASGGTSPRKSLKSCKSASASLNAKNVSQSSSDSETRSLHDDLTHRSSSPNKYKRLRRITATRSRRKDSFVPPTGVQPTTATNYTHKKNKFLNENTSRHITHFECWRTLEKSLFEKGIEMFGRNSCLIARNLLYGLKTCVEVFHALKYYENKSFQGSNSISSLGCMVESNQNMGLGSRILHKRGRSRRLKYTWKSGGSHLMRKRISDQKNLTCHQYQPCGCLTTCGDDCACLANGTCCEKYCGCPKTCKNRFRGCHCAKSQCRSRQCPCFAANRECDPDICRHCWNSCGDGSLGSPVPKGDDNECWNMNLLIGKQQRILLGQSKVSGWGAFIKNTAAKDECLGEYTGELISHHEADKRGKIYDRENSSFLFNLNDQYVVDANRKGNKLKFANHSPHPNCYAKVMMVDGEHRVGIFAKEKICAGEELFYDYRYEPDSAPAWAKKPDSCDLGTEGTPSSGRAKKLA